MRPEDIFTDGRKNKTQKNNSKENESSLFFFKKKGNALEKQQQRSSIYRGVDTRGFNSRVAALTFNQDDNKKQSRHCW